MSFSIEQYSLDGMFLTPGLPGAKVAALISEAWPEAWEAPYEPTMSPQLLYDEWCARLRLWLRIPCSTIGNMATTQRSDKLSGAAPISPRHFVRANIARKVQAHFAELKGLRNSGHPWSDRRQRVHMLLHAILRAPWSFWKAHPPLLVPDAVTGWEQLDGMLEWAQQHWDWVYSDILTQARHGLQLWKYKLQDGISSGKLRPVSRWLRSPLSVPVLSVHDQLEVHPIRIGEHLKEAWSEIYNPGKCDPMPDSALNDLCSRMSHKAWCPGPLLPDHLMQVVAKRKPSACGVDNISLQMLQALPLRAWEMMCVILNAVESGQPWPTQLRRIAMVAIQKPDTPAPAPPLKVRMIAIAPHIYRLWAATRTWQINQSWIPGIVGRFAYGGVPKRSATLASSADSFLWDIGHATNHPVAGCYMDCSKCFDCLKFDDVIQLALRVGLSPRIARALLQWYHTQERYVSVKGFIQAAIRPQRGIPQGCPLSVVMCLLWGQSWSSSVEHLLREHALSLWGCSCYMDDLALLADNRQALEVTLGFTRHHFSLWQVQLNEAKSSLLANDKAKEQISFEDFHLLREDSYKLLGISTGWTPAKTTLATRISAATLVHERLRVLHMSQSHHQRLVSCFVTPLVYGVAFSADTQLHLALDKQLRTACWGKARVAANPNAAAALGYPSHVTTLIGSKLVTAFRHIWEFGACDLRRRELLQLWHLRDPPRPDGLWATFLAALHAAQLRLSPHGGICSQMTGMPVLHPLPEQECLDAWGASHMEGDAVSCGVQAIT